MKLTAIVTAALQGLALVGVLYLFQSIVAIFAKGYVLPFSPWFGLLLSIPGLIGVVAFHRIQQKQMRTPLRFR